MSEVKSLCETCYNLATVVFHGNDTQQRCKVLADIPDFNMAVKTCTEYRNKAYDENIEKETKSVVPMLTCEACKKATHRKYPSMDKYERKIYVCEDCLVK
jgi:hypothetical protein